MINKPIVSAIIVNYNAGRHLLSCILSLLTIPNIEIIIIDNASRDNSLQNLPNNPKIKIVQNEKNLGFAKSTNHGASMAKGRYLLILNPDSIIDKVALDRLILESKKNKDKVITVPQLKNLDGTTQSSCYPPQTIRNAMREYWFGVKGAYSKYYPSLTHPTRVAIAVAAAWLIPYSLWNKIGGLNESFFLYFEDLDFCDRASNLNIPIIYTPSAVVIHAHGVSAGTNSETSQLFVQSATSYHGKLKKILLDLVMLTPLLFSGRSSPKKSSYIWFISLIFIISLAVISYFLLPSHAVPSKLISSPFNQNFLWWSWTNFDGEHYLSIATRGYQILNNQSQYAFFPLLPLLINLTTKLGLDLYIAGRLITLTASLFASIVVGKWLNHHTNHPLPTQWLLFLGTGSVFLYSVYTEPLFILLVAATFLFADEKRWFNALLCAALATSLRINGIFLLPFLFFIYYQDHKKILKSFVYSIFTLSGLLGYMVFLDLKTSNPFAFFTAQAGWGKATLTSPLETLYRYVAAITYELKFDLTHLVVYFEVFTTIILAYLLVYTIKKKLYPLSYQLYLLGNLILPLATGSLGSMPRFALTLFPLLSVIPALPAKLRTTLSFLILFTGMIGTMLFVRGYWYA